MSTNSLQEYKIFVAEGNKKEKLRIDKAYEEAKLALQIKYGFKSRRAMEKANEKLAKWLESDTAPIAASMALAAGAIQIAAIKKQQQASEAQGYAEGGYTPKGRKDQEVGVVHAGEWVASQELLANPEASAIIKTLDVAQATGNMSVLKTATAEASASNTMASLRADDVTRSITAPQVLASQNARMVEQTQQIASGAITPKVVVASMPKQESGADSSASTLNDLAATISSLNSRLNEPFVTVNTITGDQGIKKAQDEYARLIRNKTPKSRR